MSRPLRIEYPGAYYHVMNRGVVGSKVFVNDDDRERFLKLIGETCRQWGIEVYGYCLMDNHYHLLLQTPQGNVSQAMRHVDGVYTQGFNRAHRRDGPLFRGRYRAILIDAEEYFLGVACYIHRNPQAGQIDIERYRWSSHRGYLRRRHSLSWLNINAMLSRFGRGSGGLDEYRTFMRFGVQKELMEFYRDGYQRPILGGKEFVRWVKETIGEKARVRAEVPQSRKIFGHALEEIVEATAQIYGKMVSELLKRRRGRENEARAMAIYLCRAVGGHKLEDIGKIMGLKNYSPVSSANLAVKKRLELEKGLASTRGSGSGLATCIKALFANHKTMVHSKIQDLTVCRGSRTTSRLKSGAGNYRYTPLAKIRFWEATLRTEWIEKTFSEEESQTRRPYHQGTHRAS